MAFWKDVAFCGGYGEKVVEKSRVVKEKVDFDIHLHYLYGKFNLIHHFNFWAAFKAESIELEDPVIGMYGLSYLARTNLILLSPIATLFVFKYSMNWVICLSVGYPAFCLNGNKKNADLPAARTLWIKSTSLLFPKSSGLNYMATP